MSRYVIDLINGINVRTRMPKRIFLASARAFRQFVSRAGRDWSSSVQSDALHQATYRGKALRFANDPIPSPGDRELTNCEGKWRCLKRRMFVATTMSLDWRDVATPALLRSPHVGKTFRCLSPRHTAASSSCFAASIRINSGVNCTRAGKCNGATKLNV